jgi:hypothetical protein
VAINPLHVRKNSSIRYCGDARTTCDVGSTQLAERQSSCLNSRRRASFNKRTSTVARPDGVKPSKPVSQRLLPFDALWQQDLAKDRWPTGKLPEIMCGGTATLRALIREYLFISLFRACAESLASENASRLAAMQRAEKNIDELLEDLNRTFHRLRQSGIDEELFDVISGFEALIEKKKVSPGVQEHLEIPRVATRAYGLYEEGGRRDGKADQDWLEAEREIRKG